MHDLFIILWVSSTSKHVNTRKRKKKKKEKGCHIVIHFTIDFIILLVVLLVCVYARLRGSKCDKIMFKIYSSILIIKNRFQSIFHEKIIIIIIIFRLDT